MNQNYKEITNIIKTLYDDFERFLRLIDEKIIGSGKVPIGFYTGKKKRINDFADYFEKEVKNRIILKNEFMCWESDKHLEAVKKEFNKKEFLKQCGVN